MGVAVNNRGEIAVAEIENHRVQVFRSDGTYLKCFGGPGHGKGEFDYPGGIAFDQNGNILVLTMRTIVFKFSMNKENTWMSLMELKKMWTVNWMNL